MEVKSGVNRIDLHKRVIESHHIYKAEIVMITVVDGVRNREKKKSTTTPAARKKEEVEWNNHHSVSVTLAACVYSHGRCVHVHAHFSAVRYG